MIFGQQDDGSQPNPMNNRVPFQRPQEAGHYVPGNIRTGFQTQLQPFAHVLPAIVGTLPRLPGFSPMGPGAGVRVLNPSSTSIRQNLPPVMQPPGSQALPSAMTSEAAAAAAVAPGQTGPGGVSGWGFGNPGRNGRNIPYRVMRGGFIPQIPSSGRNLRRGVYGAPNFIHRQMPSAFPGASVPAGGYYPLKALPAAPMVAPGPLKGWGW